MGAADGPKPSKISKLPNFKNIHQNQFSRMESIAEYQNRKAQRAKEILTNSATKSPAPARNGNCSAERQPGAKIPNQLFFASQQLPRNLPPNLVKRTALASLRS